MKFASLAFLLAYFSSLTAAWWDWNYCLSQAAAEALVAEYAAVISQQPSDLGDPTTTAEAIAAPNYQEFSDSANIEIGLPLGGPTAPSKQAFVTESQANPPLFTETLGVYVACRNVVWQWVSYNFGSAQYEVKGIHIFIVDGNGQIETTYFEFNSVAGALDTGYTITAPDGTVMT